jgi:branched-chain amino acid transport system substrate-binding protein
MKNTTKYILGLILLISIVIFINWHKPVRDNTIRIGAVYALTGPLSSFGTEYRRGLEIAADEINESGGINGQFIEVIFEDDKGDPKESVTAVNKLINIDQVKYLFTAFSSPSQATAPIAEQNKILNFSATVSPIGNGSYVFRDYWDMKTQGVAIGEALKKEGLNSVGIIALNWADYIDFKAGLVSSLPTDYLIKEEKFNFGDQDFKTQLLKFKVANVEAILVYGFPGAETTKITQQISELGLDSKRLFSGDTIYGFKFMYEQLAPILVKMKVIDSWYSLDSENNKATAFIEKYRLTYKEDFNGDAAYPYDDLHALALAIEKTGDSNDIEGVADELRKIKYDGAVGTLTFDEKGNAKRSAYLQTYTENGWVKY